MPFGIEPAREIINRKDFGALCNARELYEAAEIGTDRGGFAEQFLTQWRGHTLLCVDDYQPYHEMPFDRTPDMMQAVCRLARFGERVRFLRAPSLDAARFWKKRLDFVYIDAAHDYRNVTADIAAWWPRVWDGGILAGHDWHEEHPGVIQAVTEFAQREGLTVYVTSEGETLPSWYVCKPKPIEPE